MRNKIYVHRINKNGEDLVYYTRSRFITWVTNDKGLEVKQQESFEIITEDQIPEGCHVSPKEDK